MILAIVGFHLIAFGWALEYALPRSHTGGVGYISYEPGIVCATVIWCAMTFATHPLSRAPRIPLTPWGVVCDVDLVVLDPEPKAR